MRKEEVEDPAGRVVVSNDNSDKLRITKFTKLLWEMNPN
jgi:hypothetical protein